MDQKAPAGGFDRITYKKNKTVIFETKMTGTVINWPGGKPKDRPDPGTNPEISVHLKKWDCRIEWASDHYELINKHGDAIEMPVTATIPEWAEACEQLGRHHE